MVQSVKPISGSVTTYKPKGEPMTYVPKHHQTIEEFQESRRHGRRVEPTETATLGCLCSILASLIIITTIIAGIIIAA